jgi:hypothetical protein
MSTPNRIIRWVKQIGLREKQGQTIQFLNRSKEPYEWMDTVPEDNLEFQVLLEEEAPFPDVSTELPGVIQEEEEEGDYQVVTNKPETLAAVALENAVIDATKQIQVARAAADAGARAGVIAAQPNDTRLIETNKDKIMYEITFDLPEEGIIPAYDNIAELPDAATADVASKTGCYPT